MFEIYQKNCTPKDFSIEPGTAVGERKWPRGQRHDMKWPTLNILSQIADILILTGNQNTREFFWFCPTQIDYNMIIVWFSATPTSHADMGTPPKMARIQLEFVNFWRRHMKFGADPPLLFRWTINEDCSTASSTTSTWAREIPLIPFFPRKSILSSVFAVILN